MADVGSTNRNLFIKKYQRNKLVAQAEILSKEIRTVEIEAQITTVQENIKKQNEKFAGIDKPDPNNKLANLKFERDKFSHMANLQTQEIRILELQEEIERCRAEIEAQNKVIAEMDFNIQQQEQLLAKGE